MKDAIPQTDDLSHSASIVSLREVQQGEPHGPALLGGNLGVLAGVKVKIEVVVGSTELTISEVLALKKGSVISLSQLHDAPLIVRLENQTIALGTLVVVDDNFGVRITDVATGIATAIA